MMNFSDQVNRFRRTLITTELVRRHGNMSATARALGVHRNTLMRWLFVLGIPRDSHRHWGGARPRRKGQWLDEN